MDSMWEITGMASVLLGVVTFGCATPVRLLTNLRERKRRKSLGDVKDGLLREALIRSQQLKTSMRVVETPVGLKSDVERDAAKELEDEGRACVCGLTCWVLVRRDANGLAIKDAVLSPIQAGSCCVTQ